MGGAWKGIENDRGDELVEIAADASSSAAAAAAAELAELEAAGGRTSWHGKPAPAAELDRLIRKRQLEAQARGSTMKGGQHDAAAAASATSPPRSPPRVIDASSSSSARTSAPAVALAAAAKSKTRRRPPALTTAIDETEEDRRNLCASPGGAVVRFVPTPSLDDELARVRRRAALEDNSRKRATLRLGTVRYREQSSQSGQVRLFIFSFNRMTKYLSILIIF